MNHFASMGRPEQTAGRELRHDQMARLIGEWPMHHVQCRAGGLMHVLHSTPPKAQHGEACGDRRCKLGSSSHDQLAEAGHGRLPGRRLRDGESFGSKDLFASCRRGVWQTALDVPGAVAVFSLWHGPDRHSGAGAT